MLQLTNVCKQYATKGGIIHALDHVSLTLPETGMVFFVGTSGAGKSTLLHVIGGLDQIDQGEIQINDRKTGSFSAADFDSYRNTMIGFIFQEYNLLPEFSVGENIAIALELQGRKATSEAVTQLLDDVGLHGLAQRRPATLSGGQKQRVAIARALIKSPAIIMADEPTGALDSATGKQVLETLKKLSLSKLVLVVSHDREYAEHYGDRIITLSDGKIVEDISKTWTPPLQRMEHLSIVEEGLIALRAGSELTKAEQEWLQTLFQNRQEDILIAVGQRARELRKPLRLQGLDELERFQPTPIIQETPTQTLQLIRSKLPFKASLTIAANSLKHKPIRLFFTIVLSTLSFSMFGLSDTLATFDKVESSLASMLESGIDYTTVVGNEKIQYTETDYTYHHVPLDTADMERLQNDYSSHTFYPVVVSPFGDNRESFAQHLDQVDQLSYSYYSSASTGFIEMSDAERQSLSFSLIGQWPSSENEIVITHYHLDHFLHAGYQATLSSLAETIADANDMIGKTLTFHGQPFSISGVLDTQIDDKYTPLQSLTPPNDDWMSYYLLQSDWQSTVSYGFHNLIYVNTGFFTAHGSTQPIAFAIAPLVPHRAELRALLMEHYRNDLDEKFQVQNSAIFAVESMSFFVEMLSTVFLVFASGLAIFSGLLLFNFISSSIHYKKREIGILRAVGARGSDVFAIFFTESLMIALINFTLAILLCFLGAGLINMQLRQESGLNFALLVVRIRQVFLLLGIATGVAFLASFFPVWRLSRKRPIDAIRDV